MAASLPPILIDIDNVIASTDEVLRAVIKERSSKSVDLQYKDILHFDYWLCKDSSGRQFEKEEWSRIHEAFSIKYLNKVQPFPNICHHLGTVATRYLIHLATSRLPSAANGTKLWLLQHKIPYSELHFVEHRKKHLLDFPFVAAIEDDCEQAQLFAQRGIATFVLAHPWNSGCSGTNLKRVENWDTLIPELMTSLPSLNAAPVAK